MSIGLEQSTPRSALPPWPLPPGVKTLRVNGYPMAYVEEGAGVPRRWAEGYAALCSMVAPPGFSRERWQRIVDAAGNFLDRWAAKAGLFLLLACAAGLVEYIRYMVKWRGVLFAAWDLLAWIGAGLAIFALIALLASLAKGCYDAIRPDPGDAHSRNHAAVRAKPGLD